MRRIKRRALPAQAAGYLRRKQAHLDRSGNGSRADELWKTARKTKALRQVVHVLRQMARRRQRCMFCEDSRGTDVEHFWPKRKYPQRAFDWQNFLLVCSGCNRAKGDRFPLDAHNQPLLIDPTAEDPWDYLFFDPVTGNLAARYAPEGVRKPKGVATLALLPLRDEAITEGRRRSYRQLSNAVREFLSSYAARLDDLGKSRLIGELQRAVEESSNYGLGQWVFCKDGQHSDPFSKLRASHPTLWAQMRSLVTQ